MPLPPFRNHLLFDPWNSASTGHQHTRSPVTNNPHWQRLREQRLAAQFQPAAPRASPDYREQTGRPCDESREPGQRDIRSMFKADKGVDAIQPQQSKPAPTQPQPPEQHLRPSKTDAPERGPPETPKQIFQGITVYLNAPGHPLLSDHKLRHLLVTHGATVSLALTRRVTHVLVGRPNAGSGRGGGGGGLAAGKLQREIARGGSRAVKVVFVEWVMESVRAEKRLAEARFAMHVAAQGQRRLSVRP
ncbi:hypothetical protein BDV59DRAFT_204988 [Aspergillus ambiguus]|uniref:uncharacterized protein n=1 Tax=Aspergillus ambiguus TaxID=176160 RepID=UPI003CCDC2EC